MSPVARLIYSIVALLGVLVAGTVGYMVIEADRPDAPNILEATYMTVITVSTVGFKEVWDISPAGRIWTIGVIIFGVGTVSVAFTSLITLFVSGELQSIRERRKMKHTTQKLRGHIILCGYGRMGAMAVEQLEKRGAQVVVIERDPLLEAPMREAGLNFLITDATDDDALQRAGLANAACLVATLPHDVDNVFITLTARALRPTMSIVARAELPTTEAKLMRAGASRVICAQAMGAARIADVITRPNIVDFVEIANKGVDLEMDEYVITEDSPLKGKLLRDSLLRRKTGASVVAIKRADGQTLFSPDPDAEFRVGDTLILVGPAGVSSRLDGI